MIVLAETESFRQIERNEEQHILVAMNKRPELQFWKKNRYNRFLLYTNINWQRNMQFVFRFYVCVGWMTCSAWTLNIYTMFFVYRIKGNPQNMLTWFACISNIKPDIQRKVFQEFYALMVFSHCKSYLRQTQPIQKLWDPDRQHHPLNRVAHYSYHFPSWHRKLRCF